MLDAAGRGSWAWADGEGRMGEQMAAERRRRGCVHPLIAPEVKQRPSLASKSDTCFLIIEGGSKSGALIVEMMR